MPGELKLAFSSDITFRCTCPGRCCCGHDEGVGLVPGEVAGYGEDVLARTGEVDHPVYARRIERTSDGRCAFLDGDKRCEIYSSRPVACRLYPLQFNVSSEGSPLLCLDRCEGVYRGKAKLSGFLEETFADMDPKAWKDFSERAGRLITATRARQLPLALGDDTLVMGYFVDRRRLLEPVRELLLRTRALMAASSGETAVKKVNAAPVVSDPLVAALAVLEGNLPEMVGGVLESSGAGGADVPGVVTHGDVWEGAGGASQSGPQGEELAARELRQALLSSEAVDELAAAFREGLGSDMDVIMERVITAGMEARERMEGLRGASLVATRIDMEGGLGTSSRLRARDALRRDLLGLELPFRFYGALFDFILELIDREGRLRGKLYLDVPLEAQVRIIVLVTSGCLETLLLWRRRVAGLRELREAFEKAGAGTFAGTPLGLPGPGGTGGGMLAGPGSFAAEAAGKERAGTIGEDGKAAREPYGARADRRGLEDGHADGPMPRITRLLDEVDYGPGGGLSGGTGWGAGPVRYTMAARLMERNPALVPLLGPGGDLFAGTTVPASPMSVLKGRFSHYEKMLPLLYAHLSPMGL